MANSLNHKIKAFTLTEVMVTMVVSALVVLLAYSALQMLNNYFWRAGQHNELYSERLGLRTVLAIDVDRCDSIKQLLDQQGIVLYMEEQAILWKAEGSTVIRQQGLEDLEAKIFKVGPTLIKGREQSLQNLLSTLRLAMADGEEDSSIFYFHKHYPLDLSINRKWQTQEDLANL